eukprot:6192825-Amphidinium_carterae.1
MAGLPFRRVRVPDKGNHPNAGDDSQGYTSQKRTSNFNPFRSGGTVQTQYDSRRGANDSRGMADASASASLTLRNTETHFEKNSKGGIKVEERQPT